MHNDNDDRVCWALPLVNGGDCCDCLSEAEHRQRCEGEGEADEGEGER